MTALLGWFLSNPTILGILAAIVGALGWGFSRELAGARKERAKNAAAETAARNIADEVDNDVGALTPEQRRERLKQWSKS